MLNIRINLTINLRKVGAVLLAGALFLAHLVTPAYAIQVKELKVIPEKAVTVSLAHLKIVTTRTDARKALASPEVKYFDAEATAFLTVYAQNWTIKEWQCVQYIWTNESHFNPKALNKGSGAYGIAQFLPKTWGNYKVAKTPQAQLQIKYGLRYIEARYGNKADPAGACNAMQWWKQHYWY